MKIVVRGHARLVKSANLSLVEGCVAKLTLDLADCVSEVSQDHLANEYSTEFPNQLAAFDVCYYNNYHAKVMIIQERVSEKFYFHDSVYYENFTGSTFTALWVYDKNVSEETVICSYEQAL